MQKAPCGVAWRFYCRERRAVIEVEPRGMMKCSLVKSTPDAASRSSSEISQGVMAVFESVGWEKVGLATFKESGLATGSRENEMPDHVYRIIEVAGSSEKSIEDAIQNAVGRASRTLRQVGWFEVVETRGHIQDGKVAHYQVALKVGFTLEDDD
jgi:dodecin